MTSKPVFGVIVEAQLQPDPRKRFTWPVYAAAARARHECPFVVIVATPDPDTARWAAPPIELGPGSFYRVYVLGPEGAPIITDAERACREPYLAMLSVMAHGQGDPETALAIAGAAAEAIRTLPRSDQRLLYWYILRRSLGEAARKAFEMLPNIQPFLNESERTAFAEAKAEGKAEGKVEGEAAGLLKILAQRGLEMTDGERARILSTRDLSLLDRWYEVALSIASVRELFELEAVQPPH